MTPTPPDRRSPAARLLGAGAKAGERVAAATGIDAAVEDALEEAIVRALRSPAVERAIVRLIQRNAVQDAIGQALVQEELADAIVKALDSEVADKVWADILASDKAQMLVERIAEAPEVRAAITEQGVGLVTDVGRRLTVVTEALDDALEKVVHDVLRRPGHEAETDQAGLLTRGLAMAADIGLMVFLYSILSGLLTPLVDLVLGLERNETLPLWAGITLVALGVIVGGTILTSFWALVGQTPGMRLLSIRIEHDDQHEIGFKVANRRIAGLVLSILPAGLGLLSILLNPKRQGWHDRIADTEVVYDRRRAVAPHSSKPAHDASDGPAGT